ncbi:hypothetical protein AaE_005916 [Aphanomyces astaci]|uniref:Uncharacterized protein n=1 Tax=Aphanomyces astaci TaxID=112090 RepID=A0A6A5AJA1_APHAT|nr:hypothetical protein AaE_005916 [Aphanomyces astaci]
MGLVALFRHLLPSAIGHTSMSIQEITDPALFLDLTLTMRLADRIGTNQIGTRALSAALGLEPETDSRFWVVRRENDAGIDAVAMWTSLTGIFLSPTFRPSDAAELGHHLAQYLPDPLPQSSGRVTSTQSFNEGYCAERYPPLTPQ